METSTLDSIRRLGSYEIHRDTSQVMRICRRLGQYEEKTSGLQPKSGPPGPLVPRNTHNVDTDHCHTCNKRCPGPKGWFALRIYEQVGCNWKVRTLITNVNKATSASHDDQYSDLQCALLFPINRAY